jgi:hypothetical protein
MSLDNTTTVIQEHNKGTDHQTGLGMWSRTKTVFREPRMYTAEEKKVVNDM